MLDDLLMFVLRKMAILFALLGLRMGLNRTKMPDIDQIA